MSKLRQWLLLTGVAIVVVLAGGFLLLVRPQHAHAKNLRSQAAQQESTNEGLRAQVAHLNAQKKGLAFQEAKLSQISTEIPDNPAMPSLIRTLSSAADSAGVDLQTIAPGAPGAQTPVIASATSSTPASTASTTSTGSTPTPSLQQMPVSLTVTGTYFNVEQFVSNVEGMSRTLLVTGISIVPDNGTSGAAAASTPVNHVTATLTTRVFMAPDTAPTGSTQ